ncbi:MAG: Fpg/Nei family DNA glycosylase [Roseiflexaceae bacterium]|nr:Fpg/Nei family DNA glycosylase [Roseiflexaceae bacterium]
MAEVPEVEVIVRDLREAVVGRRITAAAVLLPEAVRFPAPDLFAGLLAGRTVQAAERRAKHILLPLDGELLLAIHFMLWGTLLIGPARRSRPPETLIVFGLEGDQEIHFLDKLGYARAAVGPSTEVIERLDLASLGPDALDPAFTPEVMAARLAKRRGPLKTVLLNNKVFSGLGNRDADESMWLARIHPLRQPPTLAPEELAALYEAICQTLHEGLALRGTQSDLFGRPGRAKHRRNVFERTGQPCPRCGTRIAHLRIGGRNTHFCPTCQPAP